MHKHTWYVCDKARCLYDGDKADRAGVVRCVKHGAILNGAPEYAGLTRSEIRKRWAAQDRTSALKED